VDLYNTLDDK